LSTQGSLGTTLLEVQPTAFFGVPRVWEKIQEKMVATGRSRGLVSRWIVALAKYIGLSGSISTMNGYVRCAQFDSVWRPLTHLTPTGAIWNLSVRVPRCQKLQMMAYPGLAQDAL